MIIEESITSDIGVSFVALVNKPAIEKNFMAFNAMKIDFAKDEEKRIISGPAMIANSLIYRRDDNGEYNVFFSKKTIEEIALKFFKMDYQKNLNLFHDPSLSLEGVTIFESFVTDSTRGIQPMKGFEDLPDGTWFISCKVENDIIWQKIKAGEVKGFSVEGIFSYVKKPKTIEEQISEILNRTYSEQGLISKTDIMPSLKEMVANLKKQFFDGVPAPIIPAVAPAPVVAPVVTPQALNTEYTLKDGTICTIDKLEIGGVALIAGVPAPSGEHELSDGTKFTVGEGGVITEVVPIVPLVQDVAPVAKTPEQLIQAIKDTVLNFETLLANQKTEMESKLAEANTAFEEFKNGTSTQVAAQKSALELQITEANKVIAAQDKQIKGLFELVEKIADLPTALPVDDNRTSFSADKLNKKQARITSLAEGIANLKKIKTA